MALGRPEVTQVGYGASVRVLHEDGTVTTSKNRPMQRFVLYRHTDVSGTSGTGIVAEGVVFSDGSAALRWLTDISSTALYASIEDLVSIHGHGGSTEVRWVDGG
jgi:hypothetical protein